MYFEAKVIVTGKNLKLVCKCEHTNSIFQCFKMIYNKNEDSTNWYGRSFLVFLTWAQVDICKMIESRLHNDNPHQRRVKGESQRGRFAALGRRSMFSSFKESFHHYLMNSTLHGLKYVGDRNITRFERYVK